MKILFTFCFIVLVVAQMSQAQTQEAVVAETGNQIIYSLTQVKTLASYLKDGINYRKESSTDTLNFNYDAYYQNEVDWVKTYLTPMQITTTATVKSSLQIVTSSVASVRQKMLELRDTGLTVKNAGWQSIINRINLWACRDLSNFLNALMKHLLNKYSDKTIVVASVATCRLSAFTVFNSTLQNSSDTIYNCAWDMQKLYLTSQLAFNDAYRALNGALQTLLTSKLTSCMTSNSITSPAGIDKATAAQKTALVTCLNKATNDLNTFLGTYSNKYFTPYSTKLNTDATNLLACYE